MNTRFTDGLRRPSENLRSLQSPCIALWVDFLIRQLDMILSLEYHRKNKNPVEREREGEREILATWPVFYHKLALFSSSVSTVHCWMVTVTGKWRDRFCYTFQCF